MGSLGPLVRGAVGPLNGLPRWAAPSFGLLASLKEALGVDGTGTPLGRAGLEASLKWCCSLGVSFTSASVAA